MDNRLSKMTHPPHLHRKSNLLSRTHAHTSSRFLSRKYKAGITRRSAPRTLRKDQGIRAGGSIVSAHLHIPPKLDPEDISGQRTYYRSISTHNAMPCERKVSLTQAQTPYLSQYLSLYQTTWPLPTEHRRQRGHSAQSQFGREPERQHRRHNIL